MLVSHPFGSLANIGTWPCQDTLVTGRSLLSGIGVGALLAAVGCGGDSDGGVQSADGGESGSSSGGTSGTGTGGTSGAATGGSSGSGGTRDGTACEVATDCVLVPSSCCVCGVPEIGDVTAVNQEGAAEYTQTCGMGPACLCPTALNPNLVATCASETCQAIDIREHAVSECSDDDECRVRVSQCCECGGDTSPGSLVAVGTVLDYGALVCDRLGLCTGCAPEYPAEATALCESGHCTLVDERL
jgi:hypothetical protein